MAIPPPPPRCSLRRRAPAHPPGALFWRQHHDALHRWSPSFSAKGDRSPILLVRHMPMHLGAAGIVKRTWLHPESLSNGGYCCALINLSSLI